MPAPDTYRLLVPLAAAMALLLVAGVAAMVHLWRGADADRLPWRNLLARFAEASSWRGRDLLALLALVALAQIVRPCLPGALVRDVLAFLGGVVLGGRCLARHKVRPFGTPGSLGTVMNHALVRWLALLPLLWFTAFTWQLVLRAMGHAPSLQEALRLFIEGRDIWQRASLLVFAVILAPVAEEMLFRGILLPLLVRRTGAMAGLLLTAVGFAALHGNLGTFVPLAVISVALSLAYARTGSLLVPMAMHALFNGANLALLWVLLRAGVA